MTSTTANLALIAVALVCAGYLIMHWVRPRPPMPRERRFAFAKLMFKIAGLAFLGALVAGLLMFFVG